MQQYSAKNATDLQHLFFRKAAMLALKSNLNQKHGCIIVLNDQIISTGFNHTYIHLYHKHSLHAEIDALRKLKRNTDLSAAEMYVVRVSPNGEIYKMSRPCEGCTKAILKANVGKVYYSLDEHLSG